MAYVPVTPFALLLSALIGTAFFTISPITTPIRAFVSNLFCFPFSPCRILLLSIRSIFPVYWFLTKIFPSRSVPTARAFFIPSCTTFAVSTRFSAPRTASTSGSMVTSISGSDIRKS